MNGRSPDPLDLGANLLWSWMRQTKAEKWVPEAQAIATLQRFGGYLEGFTEEQCRACLVVGEVKGLFLFEQNERGLFVYASTARESYA